LKDPIYEKASETVHTFLHAAKFRTTFTQKLTLFFDYINFLQGRLKDHMASSKLQRQIVMLAVRHEKQNVLAAAYQSLKGAKLKKRLEQLSYFESDTERVDAVAFRWWDLCRST